MKKIALLFSMLLLGGSLYAQNTTVSATVEDSDSTVWANATWTLSFQVNTSYPNPASYTIGGTPLSSTVTNQTGTANGSGALSFTTYQSGAIAPSGSSFNLTICPQVRVACTVFNFQTIGTTQNISTALNAAIPAPRFNAVSGSYGYTDTEAVITVPVAATYWNTTSAAQRCYNGSTWQTCNSGGSGSGTVSGQANGVIPLATAATTIGAQSHCDDGNTTSGTVTCSEPVTSTGAVTGTSGVFGTPSTAAKAALPSGAHGFACDESSTVGVPASSIDYLRCDASSHTILYSPNGAAESGSGLVNLNAAQTLSNKSLVTIKTSTACAGVGTAASPSVVSCSAAPAGLFSCATNASGATCVIDSTAVTANSIIQIQPDSSLGTALSVTCNTTADSALTAPRVSARTASTSFTITLGTFSTNPECFSYIIVN